MQDTDKKQKIKSLIGKVLIVLVLVGISFATSSVNLMDEMGKIVKNFITAALDGANSEEDEDQIVYLQGKNCSISQGELKRAREINEILGTDNSEETAVEQLKQVKTLAVLGKSNGIAVTKEEVKEQISDLKEQLIQADDYKYKYMCDEWGSESEFWKTMNEAVEEQIRSQKVIDEMGDEFDETEREDKVLKRISQLIEKEQFYQPD